MALTVQLIFDATGTPVTWNLKAERVTVGADRGVTQLPIPGSEGETYVFDLGLDMPKASIAGIISTVSEGSNDPSREDLEDDIRQYWNFSQYETRLVIPGRTYIGVIRNYQFTSEGGLEDRWNFELVFLIKEIYSA